MREIIKQQYNSLKENIYTYYDKIKVFDSYDYYESNPYTIFYLNKKENFNEFKKLWHETLDENASEDYDTILDEFDKKAKPTFDYIELGTLNIYTDKEYELEI